LRVGVGCGRIVSGNNRDSDYDLDNKLEESSRSTSDTQGAVVDAEAMIGYDFKMLRGRVTITPWLGFAFHRQKLTDSSGVQILDSEGGTLGPFPGTNSEYDAHWSGIVFGMEAHLRLAERWRLSMGARYETLNYDANADWKLQKTFAGFRQTAEGDAWLVHAGVEWEFAPRWMLGVTCSWGRAATGHGIDDTKSVDGFHELTQLNEVRWSTVGTRISITHRF